MVWTGHLVDLLVAGPGQGHDDGSGGAELHALHRGGHVAVCTPVQASSLSEPCQAVSSKLPVRLCAGLSEVTLSGVLDTVTGLHSGLIWGRVDINS